MLTALQARQRLRRWRLEMFIEYNPNPSNSRVGDCVIRAIAKAENASWDKIYLDLCVYGLMCSDLPISNNVWGRYLNDAEK